MSSSDVTFYVHPKGHKQVDNQRRSHADEGGINEVFPHFGWRQMHAFAEMLTNAKGVSFNQIFEPVLQHKLPR